MSTYTSRVLRDITLVLACLIMVAGSGVGLYLLGVREGHRAERASRSAVFSPVLVPTATTAGESPQLYLIGVAYHPASGWSVKTERVVTGEPGKSVGLVPADARALLLTPTDD